MKLVHLDPNKLDAFEIAARLDIWLAHPKISAQMRQRKEEAWCAAQIEVTIEKDPSCADGLRARYPRYGAIAYRRSLSRLDHQRSKGLVAGVAVLPFLKESALGEKPTLAGQPWQPTQHAVVLNLWKDRLPEDADWTSDAVHQIKKREIRDWYPVAHLAAAAQYLAREMSGSAQASAYDPQDLDFLRRWVALAKRFAEIIRSLPALNTMAKQLVNFIWVEGDGESENCP